jgi:hypothetical protein
MDIKHESTEELETWLRSHKLGRPADMMGQVIWDSVLDELSRREDCECDKCGLVKKGESECRGPKCVECGECHYDMFDVKGRCTPCWRKAEAKAEAAHESRMDRLEAMAEDRAFGGVTLPDAPY